MYTFRVNAPECMDRYLLENVSLDIVNLYTAILRFSKV